MNNILSVIISKLVRFDKPIARKADIGSHAFIAEHTFIDSLSKVGAYTYIGKNCNITKTDIGRYCSIANNVSLGQGEHDLKRVSTSSLFYNKPYDTLTKKQCVIQNDVWIGTDSIVLRGVTIGNGAVVGANSVVTRDVPAYAIVVGSPAKIIKYRFDKEKQDKILKSRWWEQSFENAKILLKELEK